MLAPAPADGAAELSAAQESPTPRDARASKRAHAFERAFGVLNVAGLGFVVPVVRLARGENPQTQLKDMWRLLGAPVVAVWVFLFLWSQASSHIITSLGEIPGPAAVWRQVGTLWADHNAERDKRVAFYERQVKRNAERLAADPGAHLSAAKYTGKPTFIDQILHQLQDGLHRVRTWRAGRHSLGIAVRLQPSGQGAHQSAHPDFQARVAPCLAADRDDGRDSALYVDAMIRCSRSH